MNAYKKLLRDVLSEYTDMLRKKRDLTQEEMAEYLRITSRAYGDLERGKYCFSSIALLFLFLMLESSELIELLNRLREKVTALEEQDAA